MLLAVMKTATYGGLILAGVFATLAFFLLAAACAGQFDKGFSTPEAIALIVPAFACNVIATVFSLVAMCASGFKIRFIKFAPAVIWGGFVALLLLGAILHEVFVVPK